MAPYRYLRPLALIPPFLFLFFLDASATATSLEAPQLEGLYDLHRGPEDATAASCQVNLRIRPLADRSRISGAELWGENFECTPGLGSVLFSSSAAEINNPFTRYFRPRKAVLPLVGRVDSTLQCTTRAGAVFQYKRGSSWNFVMGDGSTKVDFSALLAGRPDAPLVAEKSPLLLQSNIVYLFIDQHCVYMHVPEASSSTDETLPTSTSSTVVTNNNNSTTATTPPPASSQEGAPACFPASARLHLRGGGTVRMGELVAGQHEIAVPGIGGSEGAKSAVRYSPVYLFTHRDIDDSYKAKQLRHGLSLSLFVRIATSSGHSVTLTPDHYLYANGRLTAAKRVRTGDYLQLISGHLSTVVAIERRRAHLGLVAPHALHSPDLFVNGIRTSSYTTAVHPRIAHILLAPLRSLVRAGFSPSHEPLGSLLYKSTYRRILLRFVPHGPDQI